MFLNHKTNGIVLRKINKQQVALLDSDNGRIDGFLLTIEPIVGSLLSYQLQKKSYGYMITSASLEDMPLSLAHTHLLFLHHVLELCYYFIPVHADDGKLFQLLSLLYQPIQWTLFGQKIFMYYLLTAIGFHPESLVMSNTQLAQLRSVSIDMIESEAIDLEFEKLLEQWLCHCIAQHPKMQSFNTIDFLTKNRRYE